MLRRLRARFDRYVRARVAEALRELPEPAAPQSLHGTYVGRERVLVSMTWGGKVLVPSSNLGQLPALVGNGIYDVPFTTFVQREIRPGDVVFDIGANIGIFTLLFAYQVWEMGTVLAYEPNPANLEVLRDNVSMNWLSDRVEIVPKGAGAEVARLPFLAPRRFSGTGSLQPIESLLVTPDRRDVVDKIEVDVEPLDVHEGRFERVALIKIDVEGGEERVFSGMERLLASGTVERVCFELSRGLLGADWEPFVARLERYERGGWGVFTLGGAGEREPASVAALAERGVVSQVLLTPP